MRGACMHGRESPAPAPSPAFKEWTKEQKSFMAALEKMQDVSDRVGALLGSQMAFGAGAMVGQKVSWIDLDGIMDMCEDFVVEVVAHVLKHGRHHLEELERDISVLERVQKPFPRITYEQALEILREAGQTVKDMLDMRALMARERPAKSDWDLKLSNGGLVDIEFAAQLLQIVHAQNGGPLATNTAAALRAFKVSGLTKPESISDLEEAWTTLLNVNQLIKLALADGVDPATEPPAFQSLLARAAGLRQFSAVMPRLIKVRAAARSAFEAIAMAAAG